MCCLAGEAVLAACEKACGLIDMRQHQGVHPCMGAVDLIPIYPLGEEVGVEECAEEARGTFTSHPSASHRRLFWRLQVLLAQEPRVFLINWAAQINSHNTGTKESRQHGCKHGSKINYYPLKLNMLTLLNPVMQLLH